MLERELKNCWRQQPTEPDVITAEQMRRRARDFQQTVRRQNLAEYLACAMVVAAFGSYIWIFPNPWMKVGALVEVGAAFLLVHRLRARGTPRKPTSAAAALPLTAFYITELARQRDFVRSAWYWHVAPLMAGMAIFVWGMLQSVRPEARSTLLVFAAIVLAFAAILSAANLRKARDLQRQIDDMISLEAR